MKSRMRRYIEVGILSWMVVLGAWAQTATPRLLPFQGKLTDANGNAVSNGVKLIQFKIYAEPIGGSAVWGGEKHTVSVNGGLVNVVLGAKTPLTNSVFNQQLYLEITVDVNNDNRIDQADPPMLPRQSILPVLFAQEAQDSHQLSGHDWSSILVSGNDPLTGQINGDKVSGITPHGGIIMWSGSVANIPAGWALCDGNNGTPNLKDRFIIGAGSSYNPGNVGGASTHNHTQDAHAHAMPHVHGMSHNHTMYHSHSFSTSAATVSDARADGNVSGGGWLSQQWHTHSGSTAGSSSGTTGDSPAYTGGPSANTDGATPSISAQSHLPPYYALAFIMRL